MESQLTPLTLLHFLMSDVFMAYFKRAEFWHRTGLPSYDKINEGGPVRGRRGHLAVPAPTRATKAACRDGSQ